MPLDPTDPSSVPATVRKDVLGAALGAVEQTLEAARITLDHFARCELLEDVLGQYRAELEAGPANPGLN